MHKSSIKTSICLLNNYQHMNNTIRHFLQSQGLNDTDIKIYLDIHRHSQSFASSIAARTEIDRTTVYSGIKRLLKKGIIIQTKVNDVTAYTAISPEIFADKLDMEMQEIQARKKAALLFVEEMAKTNKQSFFKPKIRIFEGVEAIRSLYEGTLAPSTTQKAFVNLTHLPHPLKEYLKEHFIKSKIKKNVSSKVIIAEGKHSEKYRSLDGNSNRQTKVVKNHPFELHAEIILFNKKEVAIIDFHQQIYGIVMESETLYKSIETVFDYIWDSIK